MLKQRIKLRTFDKTAKINFEERTPKFLCRTEVNNVSCKCIPYMYHVERVVLKCRCTLHPWFYQVERLLSSHLNNLLINPMFSFLTQLFCLLFSSPYICCYFMFLSQTFDGFASQIWGGPRICFFWGGALINRRYFRPSTNISLYLKNGAT